MYTLVVRVKLSQIHNRYQSPNCCLVHSNLWSGWRNPLRFGNRTLNSTFGVVMTTSCGAMYPKIAFGSRDSTGSCRCSTLNSSHKISLSQPMFYRPDALPLTQPTVSEHWREIFQSKDLFTPRSSGVFKLCLWPLKLLVSSGEGSHASNQPSWCQYPTSCQYSKSWNLLLCKKNFCL